MFGMFTDLTEYKSTHLWEIIISLDRSLSMTHQILR